jgi:hypothetical protein
MVLEKNVNDKWTDGITIDKVFQRAEEEILLLNFLKIDATYE